MTLVLSFIVIVSRQWDLNLFNQSCGRQITVPSQISGQNRAARSARPARPVFGSGGLDLKNPRPDRARAGRALPSSGISGGLTKVQARPKPGRSPPEANSVFIVYLNSL